MLKLSLRVIYGPIVALINLFIYILQNPNHPRVQSDLTLMDVGAGYFARLKFATDSEFSIDFAKEIAVLAYGVSNDNSHVSPVGEDVHTDADPSCVSQGAAEGAVVQASEEESALSFNFNAVSLPFRYFLLIPSNF
jgi:hypothetical protein